MMKDESPIRMLVRLALSLAAFLGFATASAVLSVQTDAPQAGHHALAFVLAAASALAGAVWVWCSIINTPRCLRLIAGTERPERRTVSVCQGLVGLALGTGFLVFGGSLLCFGRMH